MGVQSNLHKNQHLDSNGNATDDKLHDVKGLNTVANKNDQLVKTEKGLAGWEERQTFLPALAFVNAQNTPPSEVNGDIYILSDGTSVHANWDTSASLQDWVRYDFDTSFWHPITPTKGVSCYDCSASLDYQYDGTSWLDRSTSGLPALTSANIWVGNSSNVAVAVAMSGDATIDNAGAVTIAHVTSDGSDHGFIDQDVTSGSSPTFDGTNFTGVPLAGTADTVEIAVRNDSGVTLTKGTPVYINGYHVGSENPTVDKADADGVGTYPAIGLVAADISNNANGTVVGLGKLDNVDTSSFSVGDNLFVSDTAGVLTATRPTGATQIQRVGEVLRSHATMGVIQVGHANIERLPNIASANFWLGDGTGVPVAVTMSGDATMDNAGVVTTVKTGDWTGTFDGQEGTYYLDRANHAGTQALSTISDVTATAAEVNLLDLAGLTVGWVLSADSATTASWKAPTGGVGGSGSTNYVSKWTSATDLGNSGAFDNGTNFLLGTTATLNTTEKLGVLGESFFKSSGDTTADLIQKWVNNTGTEVFKVAGDGNIDVSYGATGKLMRFGGGGGRISGSTSGNATMAQMNLFNCALSNELNANTQDLLRVRNLGVNTFQFGSGAIGVFAIATGTPPSSDNTNVVQMYSTTGLDLIIRDEAGATKDLFASSGGDVATDAIWDAAGDLAVGTGADTAAKLVIGSTGDVLTVAGGTATWASPLYIKTTYTISESDFTAAAASETINLHTLPAGHSIKKVYIKHSTAFTGGVANDYTLEVGVGSGAESNLYAVASDVFIAVADTEYYNYPNNHMYSPGSSTQLTITARCATDDVGDITAGSASVVIITEATA
jgi:hypothetical protein